MIIIPLNEIWSRIFCLPMQLTTLSCSRPKHLFNANFMILRDCCFFSRCEMKGFWKFQNVLYILLLWISRIPAVVNIRPILFAVSDPLFSKDSASRYITTALCGFVSGSVSLMWLIITATNERCLCSTGCGHSFTVSGLALKFQSCKRHKRGMQR